MASHTSADSWSIEVALETRISVDRMMRLSALAVNSRKMKMLAMIAPSGRSNTLAIRYTGTPPRPEKIEGQQERLRVFRRLDSRHREIVTATAADSINTRTPVA